eukprot:6988286-Pyramimonas_sp.AAC.1
MALPNLQDYWIVEHMLTSTDPVDADTVASIVTELCKKGKSAARGTELLKNVKITQRLHLRAARKSASELFWNPKEILELLRFLHGSHENLRVPDEVFLLVRHCFALSRMLVLLVIVPFAVQHACARLWRGSVDGESLGCKTM